MVMPFDFIKLYRKDDEEGDDDILSMFDLPEAKPEKVTLADYEQFEACVDLNEVDMIEPCWIDKNKTTTIFMKSGNKHIALVSYTSMRNVIRQSRKQLDQQILLTQKQ